MLPRSFGLTLFILLVLYFIQPAYSFFFLIGLLIQAAISIAQIAIEEAIEARKRREEEERLRREEEERQRRQARWDGAVNRFEKSCQRRCKAKKRCRKRCQDRKDCKAMISKCKASGKIPKQIQDIQQVHQQATNLLSSVLPGYDPAFANRNTGNDNNQAFMNSEHGYATNGGIGGNGLGYNTMNAGSGYNNGVISSGNGANSLNSANGYSSGLPGQGGLGYGKGSARRSLGGAPPGFNYNQVIPVVFI